MSPSEGIPAVATLVLPLLFAGAMSLIDTLDGLVWLGVEHWSFLPWAVAGAQHSRLLGYLIPYVFTFGSL